MTYKGKLVKVNQVAEELGVRYVLEGSIRKAGNRIRITAQLIDALAGHHLWAERYERNLKEIFAVQDDLTKNIITALQVKLTEGEQARSRSRGTESLQAYLKLLQAHEKWREMTKESNIFTRQMAEETIALDPDYANAYSGRHEEAIPVYINAIRLEPLAPGRYYYHLGIAYLFAGHCKKAIAACEESLRLTSNLFAHLNATIAYGLCGREEEARAAAAEVLKIAPNFTYDKYVKTLYYKNQADVDRSYRCIKKCGAEII